jgi:hypothetical protein
MRTTIQEHIVIAAILALCVLTLPVLAIDVGDPIYKNDVSGKLRIEALYEKYDRDSKVDYGELTFTGPGGSLTVSGDEETSSAETDRFLLRGTLLSSESVSIYGDIGIVDDTEGEDRAYIIGGGIRTLAYTNDKIRLSIFGAGHYVPPYDAEFNDYDASLGRMEATCEIDYYELSAGALISGDIVLDEKTKIIPYGGVALSIIRGNLDYTFNFTDVGVTAEGSADVEEDDIVQLILGGSILFNKDWSIRIEARLLGDSSVSGGLGLAF